MALSVCAGQARADEELPRGLKGTAAPLDDTAKKLPGAHAFWVPDPEFGGRIYLLESGEGVQPGTPPLVLVHGLGEAGLRDFYPVLRALGEKRQVIAFDLPGFGRSSKSNEEYSPVRYAAVVRSIIDRYAGGFADVLGHSMGGAIALSHAGTYPQQVRRLVVVDAAGVLHREAFVTEQIRGSVAPARGLLPGTVAAAEELAGNLLRRARKFEPPPELLVGSRLLRQHALGGEPGKIAAVSLIATNLGAAIAGVTAPTLILWGERDQIAPLRTVHILVDRVADAQLTVFAGVGHVAMKEVPQEMSAAVLAHLDTTPVAPAAIEPQKSQGDYKCHYQNDLELRGLFDSITLDNCERIMLHGVVANTLVINNSTTSLVGSRILAGINADDSLISMTGGEVLGTPVLRLSESRLDLAGVRLSGPVDLVTVTSTSRVLCSVCTVVSPNTVRYTHGEQVLRPGPRRL